MTTTATRPGGARPRAEIAAKTLRSDRWWVYPLGIGAILAFFVVYSTIRIFMNKYYFVEDYGYLTPLYSPCLSDSCVPGSSHFGTPFGEFPAWLPLGLAAFPIVAGFRVTCYYYRKAYYRSFWLSPPACAVAEPHKKYTGETRFPLIFPELPPVLLLSRRRWCWPSTSTTRSTRTCPRAAVSALASATSSSG
jgi:hypothetical protein